MSTYILSPGCGQVFITNTGKTSDRRENHWEGPPWWTQRPLFPLVPCWLFIYTFISSQRQFLRPIGKQVTCIFPRRCENPDEDLVLLCPPELTEPERPSSAFDKRAAQDARGFMGTEHHHRGIGFSRSVFHCVRNRRENARVHTHHAYTYTE